MGLDTSHNCWHSSYTFFARWRNALADALGWEHEDRGMGTTDYVIPEGRVPQQDPPGSVTYTEDDETYTVDYSTSYDNSVWLGHWDVDPEDAIDVLMVHSDCEGEIPWRFTEPLARRLHEIMPLLDEGQGEWQEITLQFIDGLLDAHRRGEAVDFH